LSNHLGNVLVTVSDKKIAVASTTDPNLIAYYNADVVTANDYYPFGSQMPGRKYSQPNTKYRYGFNGKETAREITSDDYDYGSRIYDGRIGRWLSVDPLQAKFANLTPYQYCGNAPTSMIDPDGKVHIVFHLLYDANTKTTTILKITYEKGLKSQIRDEYVPHTDRGGDNNRYYDYYNYQSSLITVVNGKKGVDYSNILPNRPNGIIGKVRYTETGEQWGEWWAQLQISDGRSGMIFTSKEGENNEINSDAFTLHFLTQADLQPENIDLIVDAAKAVDAIANIKIFGTEVLKALGMEGSERIDAIAELTLKLGQSLEKERIQAAKDDKTKVTPNKTKCLTCEGGYHGFPAIVRGSDGRTKDTLKPNGAVVDTVPTKRN
jgi:RHS repeat-associated protein